MKTTEVRKMVWSLSGLVGLAIVYSLFIHWQYTRRLKNWVPSVSQVDDIFRSRAAAAVPEKGSDPIESFTAAFDLRMDGKEPEKTVDPVSNTPPPPPPKEKLSDLVDVTGIFRRSISYRLKKKPSPEDYTVDVGQKFKELEEALLKAILVMPRPSRAIVHWQGEDVVLECGEEEKTRTTVSRVPGAVGSGPAGFKGPAGAIQPGGREPETITDTDKGTFTIPRKEQDYLLENMETLIGDMQTREERDSGDKPSGVRIQKLKESSYLKQLGAREGDIVVSVNGVKVTSREQIVNHFRQNPVPPGTTQVPVEIIREGQRQTIQYRLPQ
jgi:hypothetical protein